MTQLAISLQTVIDAVGARLDELGAARAVGLAAELVHKAQGGQTALGTLRPDAIQLDADGEVGLAPGTAGGATKTPAAYLSPEQVRGAAGDRRSDVWTLGVILWEALAHSSLFEGSDAEAKAGILAGIVAPPSEYNANVPAELDAICKKALAADPAARYQSCKVMAAELSAVLDDAGYPEDNTGLAAYVAQAVAVQGVSAGSTAPGLPAPIAPAPPASGLATAGNPRGTMLGIAPIVLEAAQAHAAASRATTGTLPPPGLVPATTPIPVVEAPAVGRTATTMAAGAVPAAVAAAATPDSGRSRSPSVPPAVQPLASDLRGKSPTTPPTIAAEAPRAKSPSQTGGAAAGRTKAPTGRHPTSLPGWAKSEGDAPDAPVPEASAPKPASLLNQTMMGFSSESRKPADSTPHANAAASPAALADALARLNAASPTANQPLPPALLGAAPKSSPAMVLQSLPPGATADEVASEPKPSIANAVTAQTPALVEAELAAAAAQPPAAPVLPVNAKLNMTMKGHAGAVAEAVAAVTAAKAAKDAKASKSTKDAKGAKGAKGAKDTTVPAAAGIGESAVTSTLGTSGSTAATPEKAAAAPIATAVAEPGPPVRPSDVLLDGVPKQPRSKTSDPDSGAVDPASVVALPRRRRDSKGDMLGGWEWNADSPDAIEDDPIHEQNQNTRKRLIYAVGGAVGLLLLIVVIAFAAGGSKKPAAKKPAVVANGFESIDAEVVTAPVMPIDAAEVMASADAAGSNDTGSAAMAAGSDVGSAGSADPGSAAMVAVTPPPAPDAAAPPPDAPPPAPDAAVAVAKVVTPPVVAVVKPDKPIAKPDKPIARPDKPIAKPDKPIAKPDKPTKPDKPVAKPVDPYASDKPVTKVDAAAAYRAGLQLFAKGDNAGALATFQSSLSTNPDYAPTWRGIGMVHEKMGNKAKAKTAFKRYLKLSPSANDAEQIRERMEKL